MKVLLDTNFLIDVVRFKIDLENIVDLTSKPFTLATLDSVIYELRRISNKKTKSSIHAKVALKLVKEYKIEILKGKAQTDKALLNLTKNKNFIVATNDKELRKRLKDLGKKAIYLKSKKHLAIG